MVMCQIVAFLLHAIITRHRLSEEELVNFVSAHPELRDADGSTMPHLNRFSNQEWRCELDS